MKIDTIITDLDKIKEVVGSWKDIPQASALERDLVLERLRNLYENILFPEADTTTNESQANPTQMSEFIDLSEINSISVQEQQADEKLELEEVAQIEKQQQAEEQAEQEEELEIAVAEQKIEQQQAQQETEEVEQEAEQVEQEAEQVEQEAEEMEVEAVAEEEKAAKPMPPTHPESTSINQSLFAEDSIAVKQKLDRRVILSLYGDEPEPEITVVEPVKPVETLQQNEQPSQAEQQATIFRQPVSSRNISSSPAPTLTTVDKPHSEILGDVIGKGSQTVGDMMFSSSDKVDVATKVVTENSTTLRKMIGINDKFLMIRDLFSGDAAAYEQTISALENYTDLDDALIYIHETYSWNPNIGGTKLMIELLTRKLS